MPVSITATMTLVEPVVMSQALVALMSAPGRPPLTPRLRRPQRVPFVKAWSLGSKLA